MNCFNERKLDYNEVEMILVGNHAPFTWGKNAAKAVYNSAVLEQVAHMAFAHRANQRKCSKIERCVDQKHFERKHGPDSYYGQ